MQHLAVFEALPCGTPRDMHSLPCAAKDGEDGVCKAITQLSKELLDTNTTAPQEGGCDSSDCLFCQYRSNSPFHLNAYAGKLNSLLRKRSLNGMALSSWNSLIDTTTEQGGALLASLSSIGKRQRIPSPNGLLQPASASVAQGTGLQLTVVDDGGAISRPDAPSPEDEPHHDCRTMCGEGRCSGHNSALARLLPPQPAAGTTFAQQAAQQLTAAVGAEQAPPSHEPHAFNQRPGPAEPQVHVEETSYPSPEALMQQSARAQDERLVANLSEQAGPGISSLLMKQHLVQRRPRRHQHHRKQPQGPESDQHAGPGPLRQGSSHHAAVAAVEGRGLGKGWSFLPEWEGRPDPAPAELREVLRLPDRGPCHRSSRSSGRSVEVQQGDGSCRGSAGIICALEFSPDGRLLASGGVDKQIRLYNLSDVLGDLGANDGCDDSEGDLDELDPQNDDLLMRNLGLRRQRRGSHDGQVYRGWEGSSAAHWRGPNGVDGIVDGVDEDLDCATDSSSLLLAAVQRMPSKISSMAWSPFMDGVLTVGDYDGVLLQVHIASGHQLSDVDAHGGRKIWSVAHSHRTPHLVASAADDRCARLWAGRGLAEAVATLQPNPRASVCSVDFSPEHDHLVALACSDRAAYLYDMRHYARGPLAALRHHSRPASYCRFMGADRLVTAATDASIALWDLRGAVPQVAAAGAAPPPPVAAAAAAVAAPAQALSLQQHLTPFRVVQDYRPDLVRTAVRTSSAAPAAIAAVAAADAIAAAGPPVGSQDAGAAAVTTATAPCRVFRGHCNEKNFVGLSVRPVDGLVACGSECSRAFAYHTSWSEPLATLEIPGFLGTGAAAGPLEPQPRAAAAAAAAAHQVAQRSHSGLCRSSSMFHGASAGFVSAVCWQAAEAALVLGLPPLLASATSLGAVSLSVLARPC